MPPSEIRKEARESLRGRWGKGVCILLAYMVFTFILGIVEGLFVESGFIYLLIELAVLVISMPLSFGLIISFIKLKRGEDVKAFGFLKDGFSNFKKSWGIWFHTFVRLLLPAVCIFLVAILLVALNIFNSNASAGISILLTIVSIALYIATLVYAVSRALLYVLAYNIGYDNPELSSKACVLKSEALMKGNRGSYFLLELSFIGWAILAILTFGIGMLWLMPYMQVAAVCFYDKVAHTEEDKTVENAEILEE